MGFIEVDVEDLETDINLNANVSSFVIINAGVAVSVQNINLTIVNVEAELELIVRLGHLVDIVNRVFQSLDLNPLLMPTLNNVTDVLGEVMGEVDGLLGTVMQSGITLSFCCGQPWQHRPTGGQLQWQCRQSHHWQLSDQYDLYCCE